LRSRFVWRWRSTALYAFFMAVYTIVMLFWLGASDRRLASRIRRIAWIKGTEEPPRSFKLEAIDVAVSPPHGDRKASPLKPSTA
jgi:hypothetical protein